MAIKQLLEIERKEDKYHIAIAFMFDAVNTRLMLLEKRIEALENRKKR